MKEIYIESIENKKIKYLKKISTNSNFAKKENLFLIETPKLLNELSQNTNIEIIYNVYINDEYFDEKAFNNLHVTKSVLNSLSSVVNSDERLCFVKFKFQEFTSKDKVLVLDNVQDPGNVGTLLRSANAFGFCNVLLLNSCSIYNPKVIRSAKGSLFALNILTMNLIDGIEYLKGNKYYLIGTNLHGTTANEVKLPTNKFALVLGNEGQGMSFELNEVCQNNVKIKTSNVESLNVAIAGSILMHEFNKIV